MLSFKVQIFIHIYINAKPVGAGGKNCFAEKKQEQKIRLKVYIYNSSKWKISVPYILYRVLVPVYSPGCFLLNNLFSFSIGWPSIV